jgi:hypothetical protein
MDASSPAGRVGAGRPSVLHRWPTAVGLAAAAASLLTGASRETAAITVCVAALCYLGAAALQRPWIAWAGVLGFSLVVVAAELAGLAWWAGLGVAAVVLVAFGLLAGAPRPALTAQTAALAGFGGLAVVAVFLAPRAGMILAGLALASHAVWDVIHLRRRRVVPRSLAEACIALDVPLGLGVVVLAFAA